MARKLYRRQLFSSPSSEGNYDNAQPSATKTLQLQQIKRSLEERLKLWEAGKFKELWKNGQVIQKKLTNRPQRSSTDINRIFTKLVFEGKVGSAIKFLDENAENAVLKATPEVVAKLKTLLPNLLKFYLTLCTMVQLKKFPQPSSMKLMKKQSERQLAKQRELVVHPNLIPSSGEGFSAAINLKLKERNCVSV